ncbi:hypothetical protein L7F22_013157 [Adiantum nelumboides]|nr:hypothetical protein [Adiantum nelumboides]
MATNAVPPTPASSATSLHGSSTGPMRREESPSIFKVRPRPPDPYSEKQVLKRLYYKDFVDRWRNSRNTNSQGENPSVASDFKSVVGIEDLQFRDPIHEEACDGTSVNPTLPRPDLINQFSPVTFADQFSLELDDLKKMDISLNVDFRVPRSHDYQLMTGRPLVDEVAHSKLQERADIEAFNVLDIKETLTLVKDSEEIPAVNVVFSILQKCRGLKHPSLAESLQLFICFSGLDGVKEVGNDLVATLIECGCGALANQLFCRLNLRTEFSWTYVIRDHNESGKVELAISMFEQIKEDHVAASKFVYVALLQACAKLKCSVRGQVIHLDIVKVGLESDYYIGNTLIDVYAKCGSLPEARNVFDRLLIKDAVSWTSLISGYVGKGLSKDAVDFFELMLNEGTSSDEFVFACVLKACGSLGARERGQDIHFHLVVEELEGDAVVGNALVDMYVKCNLLPEAWDVFDCLSVQDVVSWTTLIAGFAENGYSESAIGLYLSMHEQGLIPNDSTFASILKAYMNVSDKEPGRRLHSQIVAVSHMGMLDAITATTLIEMYAKWGCMVDAQDVFDRMPKRDLISWNSLMTGYLQQGECNRVFQLFDRMKQEGEQPDEITYLCALTACSRAGLLDKGMLYFDALQEEHGMAATVKHYNCMVDILGRAGQLKEALSMLQTMPFPPDLVAWVTLLAACQKWANVEIGRQAFEATLKLDEMHVAAFHAMFNIYVEANMWEEAQKIEAMRATMEAGKQYSKSWIEVDGVIHTFVVGDAPLSTFNYMYSKLEAWCDTLKEERIVQSFKCVMEGMGKNVEEDGVCGHSEVLAALYGLISTPERTSLYIAKNSCICRDCHVVMSVLSKVENRLVSCRDVNRMHAFRGGRCCCEDR